MCCGCVVSTDECTRCVVVMLCLQMSVHGWNETITLRPGPFRSGATTSSRHLE